jgi:hypothetical protein
VPSDTTFTVLPFVGIEVYSGSLGFLGTLTIDQLRPGDQVYVEGSQDPASQENVAHWIVVFRD